MKKIRVLMADDHAVLSQQIHNRLAREADLDVVGMAANSTETVEMAEHSHPDVLLIDPIMRDGWGLATVHQVRSQLPDVSIVVLTAIIDTALKMRLREMGIQHILPKGVSSQELIGAIHEVVNAKNDFGSELRGSAA